MKPKTLPKDAQAILVEDPIYTQYDASGVPWKDITRLVLSEGAIDAYCTVCKRPSVFRIDCPTYDMDKLAGEVEKQPAVVVKAQCTRASESYRGLQCAG